MQEDNPISFKHFSLFRRIVVKKQSGILAFITKLGFAGRIPFAHGELAAHVSQAELKHFFTKSMQEVRWEEMSQEANGSQPPALLLSNLLESLDWNEQFCHSLVTMLSTLPVVRVDNMPFQFEDYHIEICASLLYRQSLTSSGFRPADFLDGITNIDTLSVRLKVVVLAYVCALMHSSQPRKKKEKTQHKAGISGVASRIFQRITGIKGS